ncbi:NAD(P)/FAD-dependent oxidoreductase [Methylobacterium aerolatum]|uniref:D-amino-acid dehydrogenase n=2 Tax=Methylobacterium aerolatum TaxID=418708 RepID=A0ABU0HZC5_9HYPH|nr:FAD-binding oxidoreductase [Methylobacterium aerolatum]MDQ0447699.1 D-amino-acid dehydrogenase [Methylobacterium aerolatum]GJD34799.1 D-amino acid dehydrogenase [Methylobacterium aerolatum]
MTGMAEIAVVGGGMVGIASAIALRERGLDVVLCDPGEARARTSYGNAGVISRGSILPMASPALWSKLPAYLRNADRALRLDYRHLPRIAPYLAHFLANARESRWRDSASALIPLTSAAYPAHERLAAKTGTSHRLVRNGWIKAYRTEEAFRGAALEREILREHGVAFDILDGHTLREHEPALVRPYARAMLLPETGSVREPGRLVEACEALYARMGGQRVRASVNRLFPDGDGWSVVLDDGTFRAKRVVLAAGAATGALTKPLGYRFAVAAERGYHRHFALRPESPPLTRPILDTGAASILAPMGESGIRVLSGVELSARQAPPDFSQIAAASREAAGTLALGGPLDNEPWLGSRPATPDGMPVIGWAPKHDGLIFAFGHGHIGLSTGPITGEIVADLATGRPPSVPINPFSADRLLQWPRLA